MKYKQNITFKDKINLFNKTIEISTPINKDDNLLPSFIEIKNQLFKDIIDLLDEKSINEIKTSEKNLPKVINNILKNFEFKSKTLDSSLFPFKIYEDEYKKLKITKYNDIINISRNSNVPVYLKIKNTNTIKSISNYLIKNPSLIDLFKEGHMIQSNNISFDKNFFSDSFNTRIIDYIENYDTYIKHPKIGAKALENELNDIIEQESTDSFIYLVIKNKNGFLYNKIQ